LLETHPTPLVNQKYVQKVNIMDLNTSQKTMAIRSSIIPSDTKGKSPLTFLDLKGGPTPEEQD